MTGGVRRLLLDTRGSFVEYLILLGLVALVLVGAFQYFGNAVSDSARKEGDRVARLEGGVGVAVDAVSTPEQPPAAGSWLGGACSGGSCNCFVAGTQVAVPGGHVSIERIRRGDVVLARDPATGSTAAREVVQTFVTAARPVVEVMLEGGDGDVEQVVATPEHPFWIDGRGWVELSQIELGARVLSSNGVTMSVTSLGARAEPATVYNLEVAELHTYLVGRAGVLVHNSCGPQDPRSSHAGWGGSHRPPDAFPPTPVPQGGINNPNNWLGGPDGVGGATTRPRIGATRPAANGGHFVLVHMSRPSYMPTNLVVPLPGATLAASGTPLAPAVWAGQVAGIGLWGAEWFAYLTDGTVWRYVPPPRPHPVIQAAPPGRR